ncbi:mesenchyme-specific cell surface glycoprotein-like isoform X2 [Mercenaria mercenaria]|nr:mesenchyme-specific cell surface glycoprotein-like isoform X2 [Mercenaria mercenaria]
MIHPIKDCSKVIVAIEAEPYIDTIHDRLVDNPGGVGVITFTDSPSGDYSYNVVDFRKFNARFTELEKTGVRWINRENNTFANDIEPEYIAFNADETKAYICLQENNAIAVFDMKTEQIEDILGLGFKNWNYYTMDASDKDGGIHMRPWPVFGMYQPDSIKHYTHQGVDYLIMGNEGDSKDYGPYLTEEIQVKDVELSSLFESNETIRREMQEKSQLGRLKVAAGDGKNRETGKYDKLYAFGGRSFSIRRADTMELVYDSGIEIAHKTSLLHSNLFNSGYKEGHLVAASMDSRSDNKGPETESVTMGHFGDTTLLMIGNERPGTIAVYTIDERLSEVAPTFVTLLTGINRTDDTWDNLYKNREISMLDPEDIRFIQGEESPNGKPLLLVSGSTSGTVSIIEVNVDLSYQQDDPVTAQIRSSASFVCLSKVLLVIYIGLFLWGRWERNLPV